MSTHQDKPNTTIVDEDGSTFPKYVLPSTWQSDPGAEPIGTGELQDIDTVQHVRAAIRYLRAAKCYPVPGRYRIPKSKDGIPYLVVCQTHLQKEMFNDNALGARPHGEALALFHKAAFRFFNFRAPFPDPSDVPKYVSDADDGYEDEEEDDSRQQQVAQPRSDVDMDIDHLDLGSDEFDSDCTLSATEQDPADAASADATTDSCDSAGEVDSDCTLSGTEQDPADATTADATTADATTDSFASAGEEDRLQESRPWDHLSGKELFLAYEDHPTWDLIMSKTELARMAVLRRQFAVTSPDEQGTWDELPLTDDFGDDFLPEQHVKEGPFKCTVKRTAASFSEEHASINLCSEEENSDDEFFLPPTNVLRRAGAASKAAPSSSQKPPPQVPTTSRKSKTIKKARTNGTSTLTNRTSDRTNFVHASRKQNRKALPPKTGAKRLKTHRKSRGAEDFATKRPPKAKRGTPSHVKPLTVSSDRYRQSASKSREVDAKSAKMDKVDLDLTRKALAEAGLRKGTTSSGQQRMRPLLEVTGSKQRSREGSTRRSKKNRQRMEKENYCKRDVTDSGNDDSDESAYYDSDRVLGYGRTSSKVGEDSDHPEADSDESDADSDVDSDRTTSSNGGSGSDSNGRSQKQKHRKHSRFDKKKRGSHGKGRVDKKTSVERRRSGLNASEGDSKKSSSRRRRKTFSSMEDVKNSRHKRRRRSKGERKPEWHGAGTGKKDDPSYARFLYWTSRMNRKLRPTYKTLTRCLNAFDRFSASRAALGAPSAAQTIGNMTTCSTSALTRWHQVFAAKGRQSDSVQIYGKKS